MTPAAVLDIIRLSLEITLEVIRGIPLDQRQKMWDDHQKRIKFWDDLFQRLSAGTTLPAMPGTTPRGDHHG